MTPNGRWTAFTFWAAVLATAAAQHPVLWLVYLAAALVWLVRRTTPRLSEFGTAAFATTRAIAAAGFVGSTGIVLGRDKRGRLLRVPAWATHCLIVGPTGTGKGVGVILPTLLSDPRSMIVLDPKHAENYQLTARHRAAAGHTIVRLDPFHAAGPRAPPAGGFNVLDILQRESPTLADDCRVLAAGVIRREPTEHTPFFNDMSVIVLQAFLIFVVCLGTPEERHFGTVCSLIRSPLAFAGTVSAMRESTECGGALAELGGTISALEGKEKAAVIATLCTHLAAFESEPVRACLRTTTFDLPALRHGTTLYLCMDASTLVSHAALIRLWLTALILHLIRHPGPEVLILADEIGNLGPLPVLDVVLNLLRGFSVKLAAFVQSAAQLDRMFPNGQAATALANFDVQAYLLPPNDLQTATQISERMGDATIEVASRQSGRGYSVNYSHAGTPETHSYSTNDGVTMSRMGRRLMRPEEVLLYTGRVLIFARGVRPILAHAIRYFADPAFTERPPRRWSWWILVVLFLLGLMAFLAVRPANPSLPAVPPLHFGAPAADPRPPWRGW